MFGITVLGAFGLCWVAGRVYATADRNTRMVFFSEEEAREFRDTWWPSTECATEIVDLP